MPDLTAGSISPTSATKDASVTLSSMITNNGPVATGKGFSNIFQFCSQAAVNGSCPDYASTLTPQATAPATMAELGALGSGTNTGTAQISHTFNTVGTYAVRSCADKTTSWGGAIPESDEGNNCGGWTDITVNPIGSVGNWSYLPDCQTCGVVAPYDITQICINGATCTGSPSTKTCPIKAACPVTINVNLLVDPTGPILKGRSATITWSSNANDCYSWDLPTKVSTSGSPNVGLPASNLTGIKVYPTSTTSYALTCESGALKNTASKTVKVIVPVTVEN
jgi:hypothetical protein